MPAIPRTFLRLLFRTWSLFALAVAVATCADLACAQTTLDLQVEADNDDAEEDNVGTVSLNDDTLDLGAQQWVGLRFNLVTVPPGATITSAYVEMRATDADNATTDLTIFGEDADDAATFSGGSNNLSGRTPTDASVVWSNVENWKKNKWHATPDISSVIQEIVDRGGWVDGNDLVVLIRSDDLGGIRRAFAHDDNGNKAAKMHIEYVVSAGGLLGHWVFDEGTGITAADSTASANDASLQAGAIWTSDCQGTSAIEFNGVGADAITAQPFNPPAVGSVAFWMRSAGVPLASGAIFGLGDDWEVRQQTDGTLAFDLGANGPTEFVTLTSLDQNGRWYHVVAVFDASDDSFQVYVDGQLETSGINSDDMVSQSAGQLSFGNRTGSASYWEGALRDVRIYGNKLTADEIAGLYGILAYWKFDETSGTIAVDSSGRGNDATYVGSPTLGQPGAFPTSTNTAVELDGISQYVTAGASLLNDMQEFTLSGWIRTDSVTPDVSLFGQHDIAEVGIDNQSNELTLNTGAAGMISASGYLALGQWTHVAAVGNGVDLRLYVDGVEVTSGGTAVASYGTNSNVFKIGEGVLATSGDYFDGRVDEVRVFERAMCPEEIRALYKGGRPGGVRILRWLEIR